MSQDGNELIKQTTQHYVRALITKFPNELMGMMVVVSHTGWVEEESTRAGDYVTMGIK